MKLTIDKLDLTLGEFRLTCSLEMPSGKLTTLLGPSGCGKTSLLKSIAGLYSPSAGSIRLGDRELNGLDPRYRKIGMVFQDYALFPHMNVQKNIGYGMPLKGKEAAERCTELLKLVELEGFEERRIEELSGGEKQRIALARALASEPDLLLLDEPLSALDARLRKILRRQIREIQQQTGITTVYVTHDQEEAMAISDQVVLMNKGKIVQADSPEEIYRSPADSFAGDFFGNANILSLAEGGRLFTGEMLNKILTSPRAPSESEAGAQSRGTTGPESSGKALFFRPESCRILEADSEIDTNQEIGGRGTVCYREFGGDFHYLELKDNELSIKIKSPGYQAPETGSTVSWAVSLKECRILA
ncbi:MAG: ABC transporter ATP-binding protein [Spirochaetales bacterium]|nr:ABC transporter ATP-binding protein [Spirochaetales bacterium]